MTQNTLLWMSSHVHSMCGCMYVCMYVRTYVRTYVCMYVSMYVCMYVCMHACMYVCKYVYIYIYTYIYSIIIIIMIIISCFCNFEGVCRIVTPMWHQRVGEGAWRNKHQNSPRSKGPTNASKRSSSSKRGSVQADGNCPWNRMEAMNKYRELTSKLDN